MKHYHHVTDEERFYIWNASREGVSQKKIAETLGRHPSTISREMKRNRMPRSLMYTHYWACEMVKWRKGRVADAKHRKVTGEIAEMIEQLVKQYLSPEQVCGYLKEHHSISLSHETIYRYIYEDKGRHQALKPFLRQGNKLRRKRYGSGARASKIPNRVCITDRPKIVEEKTRIGDWECDTVVGLDRKSVLITLVDRATLFTCCARVYTRKAKVVSSAIIRMLKPHIDKVKTLTFDNGSEFVEHEKIAKSLKQKPSLHIHIHHGNVASMKILTVYCANSFPRKLILKPSQTKNSRMQLITSITDPGKQGIIKRQTNCSTAVLKH